MKLAVITDSSAYLPQDVLHHDDLFILEIPIYIDGESYVEGKNLTHDEFYQKMAASKELPKTSQPSVAALEELLSGLTAKGYTHALGLFLSSGISGFYQNIQYLKDEFEGLTVEFPDSIMTKVSSKFLKKSGRKRKRSSAWWKSLMKDSPEGITKSLSSMLMYLKKPKRFVRCWWLKEWKEKFLLLPLEA